VRHREAQQESDVAEVFHRIAQIKLRIGERVKAVSFFEKALEIRPGHHATLEALVEIHSQAAEWETVVRHKRALLAHARGTDEKLALHDQIIGIYKDKAKNPQKAIAAYL
jgi:tetratricopeptide (TPR) repeat protein